MQQLEPIRAIRVEKLGIQITINPLRTTKPVRRQVYGQRGYKCEVVVCVCVCERERERERHHTPL